MGTVEIEEASVLDVTYLSHHYLITALHKQCPACCTVNVSLGNVVGWPIVADTHSITGLRATLLKNVTNNLAEIGTTIPNTQATLAAHPLLIFACLKASTSPLAV
jgi:hypothetical protein